MPATRQRAPELVKVVHVQNADVFGSRQRNPFVHRIGLPRVGFRYPPQMRMCLCLFAENLHGPIGGTAVDDDVLDPSAVLSHDGFDAPENELLAVVHRGNDAEQRCHFHVTARVRPYQTRYRQFSSYNGPRDEGLENGLDERALSKARAWPRVGRDWYRTRRLMLPSQKGLGLWQMKSRAAAHLP